MKSKRNFRIAVALMTEALKGAAADAQEQGYMLKIYDAYRPQTAVDNFIAWAEDIEDTRMKEYFYPELDKSVLFDQGYIAEKSGHLFRVSVEGGVCPEEYGKYGAVRALRRLA